MSVCVCERERERESASASKGGARETDCACQHFDVVTDEESEP